MLGKFYIYIYLKPWNLEPLYIGKGARNRMTVHMMYLKRNRHPNSHFQGAYNKAARLGLEMPIVKIREGLTETQAFEIEAVLIKAIGRRDLKEGPLCNLTNGGDGEAGKSEAVRAKISAAAKLRIGDKNPFFGRKHTPETNLKNSLAHIGNSSAMKGVTGEAHPWWGRKHTEDHKKYMSELLTGRIISEETRQKLREADGARYIRGTKWWSTPEGKSYRAIEARADCDVAGRGVNFVSAFVGRTWLSTPVGHKVWVSREGVVYRALERKFEDDMTLAESKKLCL